MSRSRRVRGAAGFTIVEVLVALLVGALLVAGTITIFTNVQQNYRANTAMARLQETGTFATEFLLGDIRLAGFFGCADDLSAVSGLPGQTATDLWYVGDDADGEFGVVIEGIDNAPDGSVPEFVPGGGKLGPYKEAGTNATLKVLPGSDAITIRYLSLRNNNLEIMSHAGDSITVRADPDEAGFTVGAIIGLSDCGRTELAQIETVGTPSDGEVDLTLKDAVSPEFKRYGSNERRPVVGALQAVRYFVACVTSCTASTTHEPVPTLYRVRLGVSGGNPAESDAEPLFRGVEQLDLWYGRDLAPQDGTIDEFVLAPDIGSNWEAWHRVLAVRLRLTVRTIEKIMVNREYTTAEKAANKPIYENPTREFTGAVDIRNL